MSTTQIEAIAYLASKGLRIHARPSPYRGCKPHLTKPIYDVYQDGVKRRIYGGWPITSIVKLANMLRNLPA